jgi:hypothetical protein
MTLSPSPSRRQARRIAWLASAGVVAGCVFAGILGTTASFAQRPPGWGVRTTPTAAPVFTNPTSITNPYLPLSSLNLHVLEGQEEGAPLRVELTRKTGTKTFTVNGKQVETLILEERESVDGELAEVSLNYFAQADDGTVYYFGEDVDDYEDGEVVDHSGAWLYGVHTQKLGVIMPAQPKVGDRFRPEDVAGITREDGTVVSVSETVTVPAGMFTNVLRVREDHPDDEVEFKYYAPGVGLIKEVEEDEEVSLISHR